MIQVLTVATLTRYRLPELHLGSWSFNPNLPLNKPPFDVITDFAMFGATTFETLAVASVFVFRWKRPDAERPYRCWGYPFVPAIYVIILAVIVTNMFFNQGTEALAGVGFILTGAAVYGLFLKRGNAGRKD